MTPFYQDDHFTLWGGDCREVLAAMPAESVHCVVTSPPYWGLRDYGTATWDGGDPECDHDVHRWDGPKQTQGAQSGHASKADRLARSECPCGARRIDAQLGLEPTPEEYVANMVAVFREVRRVLRADGTLWLNLGSSYMASPAGNSPDKPSGFQQKSRAGRSGALAQFGGTGSTRSRRRPSAPAYGTDGTEPQGSSGPGSACPDLCDGCRAALSSRTTDTPRSQPVVSPLRSPTGRGTEPPGSALGAPGASPLDAPGSTTPQSETPPLGRCSHCDNCGVCLAVMRSPSRDARECVRRSGDSDGTGSPSAPSAARMSGTEPSGLAWGDYTSTIKPKDMVPIPWMVAMALQADGWYLRSDIIWAKPNPMPESVTDRPTKAHEYLFLLSKSPRYYYDADAVREPFGTAPNAQSRGPKDTPDRGPREGGNGGLHAMAMKMRDGEAVGRNLRSVWTIATEPYPGAHFATFPRKLVEPCVKAGCPEGGTVLDPFAGSGTTLLVAQALGRKGIGIDLNPEYLKQAIVRASRSFGRAAITEQTDKRPDQGLWALDGVPE